MDVERVNPLLDALGAGTLLPPDTSKLQVTTLNTSHEVFADVFESVPENIDLPAIRKHFPQHQYNSGNTDVLMELQNTEAFVSMTRFGKGRVYIVTAPMDEKSSNFAQHAIWVPLVYRMAMLSRPQENLYYTIGENLEIEVPKAVVTGDQSFLMKLSGGKYEFIPGYRSRGSTAHLYLYDQLKQAGHYTLSSGGNELGLFAFNYDREESDPGLLGAEYINEALASSGSNNVFLMKAGDMPVSQYIEEFDKGREFWKTCIWIALTFIFIEILLLRFWR
jgi:hypothetical protein